MWLLKSSLFALIALVGLWLGCAILSIFLARTRGASLFSVNWLVNRIHRRHVEEAIRAHSDGRILDIGCGVSPFATVLQTYSDTLTNLEFDRHRSVAVSPDIWGSGLTLPFRGKSFDTVVSFQVLEHVPRPAKMVEEIWRVLVPGGLLILTAPHIWGIHEEPNDYFRFTGYGLRQLAEDAGLKVVSVQPLAGYWVTTAARHCHYLQQFEKIGLALLMRPLYALIQLVGLLLDRIHRVESDAWNFMLIAERPQYS